MQIKKNIQTFTACACRPRVLILQVLGILLYRLVLDGVYIWQISSRYQEWGFLANLSLPRYLLTLAAVLFFSPVVAAVQQDPRPSSILITILNYLYFIPLTSYCGCKGTSLVFFLCGILYWAVLLFLHMALPSLYLQPLNGRRREWAFILLTIGSVLFVLYISGRYTGFRLTFDVIHVYQIRAEAATYVMPAVFRYLLSFMPITLSMGILYALQRKQYAAVVFLLVIYQLYFSIEAHKAVFFFIVLLVGCWLFYRDWMLRWMGGLLTCVAAGCGIFYALGFIVPLSLLIRRVMYIPVQISENYYLFFSENPLNLFRYGIMGKFSFQEIYSTSIPYLLGEFEHEISAANNGMLGDMFANLPIPLGILLMPLLLVLCFRLLDMVTKGLPVKIVGSFCLFFAVTFINSCWSIVLLTHGFLLACLLLYFFPRKEEDAL